MIHVKKNIVANMAGRMWGFASVYLFIPIYLRYLGLEAFGLVGFYSTLLGVLTFADIGFSATLNREMARLSAQSGGKDDVSTVLHTYERIYICICCLLSAIVWLCAPAIAEHWLRIETLKIADVTMAIRLMGAAAALQLLYGLYISGLMGLQKQVAANTLQIGAGAFRSLGAVIVLWQIAPTIVAFACWQLVSNFVSTCAARQILWAGIRPNADSPRFAPSVLKKTWRYAAGMAAMASASTLLTQVDKITVSKMLPLATFGYYTLAAALATAPLMAVGPIGLAVYPQFAGMVAIGDLISIPRLYQKTCEVAAIIAIPFGLTAAFFAEDLVYAWTGRGSVGVKLAPVATLLLLGQLMQALTLVPFYVALAYGELRIILYVQAFSVLLLATFLVIFVRRYGMIGAGMAWLALNICTIPPYMYAIHNRILAGEFTKWFKNCVGLPVIISLPIVMIGRCIMPHIQSRILSLCSVGLVSAVAACAAGAAIPWIRRRVMKKIGEIVGLSYRSA